MEGKAQKIGVDAEGKATSGDMHSQFVVTRDACKENSVSAIVQGGRNTKEINKEKDTGRLCQAILSHSGQLNM